jgi:hypothetical protein
LNADRQRLFPDELMLNGLVGLCVPVDDVALSNWAQSISSSGELSANSSYII